MTSLRDRRDQIAATLLRRHILHSEFATGAAIKLDPMPESDVPTISLPTGQYLW